MRISKRFQERLETHARYRKQREDALRIGMAFVKLRDDFGRGLATASQQASAAFEAFKNEIDKTISRSELHQIVNSIRTPEAEIERRSRKRYEERIQMERMLGRKFIKDLVDKKRDELGLPRVPHI